MHSTHDAASALSATQPPSAAQAMLRDALDDDDDDDKGNDVVACVAGDGDNLDATMLRRLYYYGDADAHARDVLDAPVVRQLHRHLHHSTLTPYCTRARLMGSRVVGWAGSRRDGNEAVLTYEGGTAATTAAAAAGHDVSGVGGTDTQATTLPPLPPRPHMSSPPLPAQPPPPHVQQQRQGPATHTSTQHDMPGEATSTSTMTRSRRAQSLFGAPRRRGSSRYRAIADLELFMATGVLNERTMYFADAMQRRKCAAGGGAAAAGGGDGGDKDGGSGPLAPLPTQCVLSLDTAADPRSAAVPWQRPTTSSAHSHAATSWSSSSAASQLRIADVVPRRALLLKYNYEQTTGMVKPYAMGASYHAGDGGGAAAANHALDHALHESSMNAYVAAMRCHRPTKGVYALR